LQLLPFPLQPTQAFMQLYKTLSALPHSSVNYLYLKKVGAKQSVTTCMTSSSWSVFLHWQSYLQNHV